MSNVEKSVEKTVQRAKKPITLATDEKYKDYPSRIYLKAMPLRTLSDLDTIRSEVNSGNILILNVSPLARKSIGDIKKAVAEMCDFAKSVDGDIARLGEERVVITPPGVRIWREKAAAPEGSVPTAA